MVKYVVKFRDPDGPDWDGYLQDDDGWFGDRDEAIEYDLLEAAGHVARLERTDAMAGEIYYLVPVLPKRERDA